MTRESNDVQFKDIGSDKGILINMGSTDLLLLAKVCRATLAGDLPEEQQATIDAMGAAFEAAALCEWLGGEIAGGGFDISLSALREAGSIDAAVEVRDRNEKNGK